MTQSSSRSRTYLSPPCGACTLRGPLTYRRPPRSPDPGAIEAPASAWEPYAERGTGRRGLLAGPLAEQSALG